MTTYRYILYRLYEVYELPKNRKPCFVLESNEMDQCVAAICRDLENQDHNSPERHKQTASIRKQLIMSNEVWMARFFERVRENGYMMIVDESIRHFDFSKDFIKITINTLKIDRPISKTIRRQDFGKWTETAYDIILEQHKYGRVEMGFSDFDYVK